MSQKFLAGAGVVVVILFSSSLITMQNLLAVCHTVWAYVENPPKLEVLMSCCLGVGIVHNPLDQTIWPQIGPQKSFAEARSLLPWDGGMADLETLLPHTLPCYIWLF